MNNTPPRFGFESRAGQFNAFLISDMLLPHRDFYLEFPGLRTAESYFSMGSLAGWHLISLDIDRRRR